jgi:hypothetical protein
MGDVLDAGAAREWAKVLCPQNSSGSSVPLPITRWGTLGGTARGADAWPEPDDKP